MFDCTIVLNTNFISKSFVYERNIVANRLDQQKMRTF